MLTVIPAIIEPTVSAVQAKLDRIAGLFDLVHIDVADGVFVSNDVLDDPGFLDLIKTQLQIELHLMIELPDTEIEQWNHPLVRRFCIHTDAVGDLPSALERIKITGKEVFAVLNPETDIEAITNVIADVDGVVCMGVYPGYGGQQLIESVVEKIQILHTTYPHLCIAVDGGVRLDNASRLVQAGAHQLVVGTALFEASDIAKALEQYSRL